MEECSTYILVRTCTYTVIIIRKIKGRKNHLVSLPLVFLFNPGGGVGKSSQKQIKHRWGVVPKIKRGINPLLGQNHLQGKEETKVLYYIARVVDAKKQQHGDEPAKICFSDRGTKR